jgi:hypothetical protein
MSHEIIELKSLTLDDQGRVVLGDNFVDSIEKGSPYLQWAGGTDDFCQINDFCEGGTPNPNCLNSYGCSYSTNSSTCSNPNTCYDAHNTSYCR